MSEQEFMKRRISLRDVFRSTPQARKDYVKGVDKFNLEIKLAKAEKIRQQKALDDYNRQMAQAFKKAQSGGGSSLIYVTSTKPKEETKTVPTLTSTKPKEETKTVPTLTSTKISDQGMSSAYGSTVGEVSKNTGSPFSSPNFPTTKKKSPNIFTSSFLGK